MPTQRLPASADITHLKHQAKDLLLGFRGGEMSAYQRVRDFHPKLSGLSDSQLSERRFGLSDAQVSIAREYGYASWPRLREAVAHGQGVDLIHNERIEDDVFCQALDFLDEGNEALLRAHLAAHPEVVDQRITFEGDNYFTEPTLLEFVAENPVRRGELPENITKIVRIILEAGAGSNRKSLDETVLLVASGRIARECGVQRGLLEVLCDYGADPNAGVLAALGHGELDAVAYLLSRGARLTLSTAVAMEKNDDVERLLEAAPANEIQLSLSMAALHNRAEVIPALIASGADPNHYSPPGGHTHCTPLHSAAWEGHLGSVKALIEGGARLDIGDIHHNATALAWAEHAGQKDVARYLASIG